MILFRTASDVEPGSIQLGLACNLMQSAGTLLTESNVMQNYFHSSAVKFIKGCRFVLPFQGVETRHFHQCCSVYGHFLLKHIGLITDTTVRTSVISCISLMLIDKCAALDPNLLFFTYTAICNGMCSKAR